MIKIAFLADHLEVLSILAQWFRAQWPDYFAGKSIAAVESDFHAEANFQNMPIRLLAFVGEDLAGTIVLRKCALNSLPEYAPGLGGFFVAENYRRRGVGSELIKAGIKVAREHGYERLFAGTSTAYTLFESLGWEPIAQIKEGQEIVVIYRYIL